MESIFSIEEITEKGVIYYVTSLKKYAVLINDIIIIGEIHNVVPRTFKSKTAYCTKNNNCLNSSCDYYHENRNEELNFISTLWNKLIHNKLSLTTSIRNFKRKKEKEKEAYLKMHDEFVMHNLLICIQLHSL